jgi:hypothetical protein
MLETPTLTTNATTLKSWTNLPTTTFKKTFHKITYFYIAAI